MEHAIVQEDAPVLSVLPAGSNRRWGVLLLESGRHQASSVAGELERGGLFSEVRGVRTAEAFEQELDWDGLDAIVVATGNRGAPAALGLALRRRPDIPLLTLTGRLLAGTPEFHGLPAGNQTPGDSASRGAPDAAMLRILQVLAMPPPSPADAPLVRSPGRIATLSGHILAAQEEERQRVARELHDEIGQSLTVIKLHLQRAQKSVKGTAGEELAAGLAVVNQVLAQVRGMCLELRPPQLDQLGLVPALRWHVDSQAAAGHLVASFTAAPLPARLTPELETACFRIAQEAVTNVLRHAHAHKLQVILEVWDDLLSLRIEDDGCGFDLGDSRNPVSFPGHAGLYGMEERACTAGGALEIDSVPGGGTRIKAVLPLRYRSGPEH